MKFGLFINVLVFFVANSFAQWNIHTVDKSGSAGNYSDIAFDSQGIPHIIYQKNNTGYYSFWNNDGWSSPAAVSGPRGNLKINVSPDDQIYIIGNDGYRVHVRELSNNLLSVQLTDRADGGYYGLVFEKMKKFNIYQPHIVSYSSNNIYHNWYDAHEEQVISSSFSANNPEGHFAIALDSQNLPHIVFYDNTIENLKYAKYDGVQWNTFFVDETKGTGKYCSIVIDDNDKIHITYYDESANSMKYATLSE